MSVNNSESLFFYDLETSGFYPAEDRIMQFAGQRTDLGLNPSGEAHNYLIKLSEDVLPSPQAILLTGITPQKTLESGLTEAEFLKLFYKQIAVPGTVFVGFNSIRFDDEFTRYLNYRNFYDPYEWSWREGRSRWDILDLVRMTRALRPDGINWPADEEGQPINRLEPLAKINNISHEQAHDALSDVVATIGLARLILQRQPKLFNYLFKMREKAQVSNLVEGGKPFVYTSGKYENRYEKTTVVGFLAKHPDGQASLVFDLRYNPADFEAMSPEELVEAWQSRKVDGSARLPVKTLKYNRCPAIAPLSVLDESSTNRLDINMNRIETHFRLLASSKLSENILAALKIMTEQRESKSSNTQSDVDSRIYEGFFDASDKSKLTQVRRVSVDDLKVLKLKFNDWRLNALFPLYKARNYPETLTSEEQDIWDRHKADKTYGDKKGQAGIDEYIAQINELLTNEEYTAAERKILEELRGYGQSLSKVARKPS